MEENNSSIWDDLSAEFNIHNQQQAEQLVSILDQARIDRFSVQVSFEAQYQRVEFDNQLQLQTEGFENDSNRNTKKRYRNFLRKPENYPNEYIMQLGKDDIRSKIFMNIFQEEVGRIQAENNYKVFSDRSKLRIFMKEGCELNMLTKNKLFQMKEQLCVFHTTQPGIVAKFNNSIKLREQLEQSGISCWFKWFRSWETGFFFSKKLLLGEIEKKVYETGRFNISLLNFRSDYLTRIENTSNFDLLAESIAEQVAILQDEYEVEVEFNHFKHCLIVHKKHACFGKEVETHLKLMINSILLISIKSKEIRTFVTQLRKELKNLPFLKEKMKNSRNETFLAINLDEIAPRGNVNPKHLENLLKFFKIIVDASLQIKIFFHHLDSSRLKQERDRVIELAEDNHLHLKNEQLSKGEQTKGTWTIKDISEAVLPKRQREVIEFIKALIVRDENKKVEYESIIDSFFEQSAMESVSMSQEEISLQKTRFHEKGRMEWFTQPFKMPKLREIEGEDKPYLLDHRRRDLEKVFQTNSRAKFKIWGLELNNRIRWPEDVQGPPYFIRRAFNGLLFNDKYQSLNPSSLHEQEQGLVVFMSNSINQDFIPVLLLERL